MRATAILVRLLPLVLSIAAADPGPTLDISADSPALQALRRIQTRSALLLPSQAFPQTDGFLPTWLDSSSALPGDSAILAFWLPRLRPSRLGWHDLARGNSLAVIPMLEAGWRGISEPDSGGSRLLGVGGTVDGNLGPRLTFHTHALVYTEWTDKAQFTHQYSPDLGETYSVEKGAGDSLLSARSFNRFECYALADLPWGITLKAGRDRVHMGPGYFTDLTASRDTPPYWLVEARVDFAPWLSLDDYLLAMTDTDYDILKYANLHRFEFKPVRGFSLAFKDIVIYQDRDPDWTYAIPLVPLTFSEANGGGRDNAGLGFDFLYSGLRNVSVWGDLFVDDLLGPTSFFDDFWENRWAGLAGFQVTSPFPRFDADLVVEYGHVEPWTYNGRKPQTSFKHFNVPSASRLGPDSRTWDTRLSWRPIRQLEASERFSWTDKGLGRPGTLGAIHSDALDGQTKAFLGGPVESHRIWESSVRWLWDAHFSGTLSWTFDAADESHQAGAWVLAQW